MNKNSFEIYVFGLGFVGLTTALSFADKNFKVTGIDKNIKLIDSLKKGNIPFNEPYLDKKLRQLLKKKIFRIENQITFKK